MGLVSESELERTLSETKYEAVKLALDKAVERYIELHPLSKTHHGRACQYMPGGNTRTSVYASPFPLAITSAESTYLTTADGHKYVDFLGEYTVGIFGHNNPIIREAIEKALEGGWNYGGCSLLEQKFAQIVCERFPAMDLVRFVNSGTEANMMALATAVHYTQKKSILMFYGAYHGGTISGKVVPGKPNVNLPHDFVIGRFNDIEGTRALVESPCLKDSLAAIIVEPMMGSGGCFAATPEFLRSLQDIACERGAILIFDEVMNCRLGYHGLAYSLGIIPDLMTIGKWVGGGMTFGAFGGRVDLMKMYDPRSGQLEHSGTFNNNIFTMSAGIAGCTLLNEDKIRDLNNLGDNMRKALEQVFEKYTITGIIPDRPIDDDIMHSKNCRTRPPKMFVTGLGSIMTIHFCGRERHFLQMLYYLHMLKHGIYMAQRGFVALNIENNSEHVDKFVNATDKFCQKWATVLQW